MIKILRALSGHSQNRSLDEEALASRKNYLFDQVRSPYSVFVNTSTLVPFFYIAFILLLFLASILFLSTVIIKLHFALVKK